MQNATIVRLSLLAVIFVCCCCYSALGCDIIVHLKSDTNKRFDAQITAPNGKKSEKWTFKKKHERKTFQQNPNECGLKDWQIVTYENGKQMADVKVTLNGIGRVTYMVGDDLKPVQKDRQGAMCTGQCAPLASPVQHRKISPATTPKPK